ncbi:MAG: alpha-glucan family phosphorylase [Planctomycetes bacterium]|nr:alpha-glucan family phosphorylase [Planctomycetota bacterium]
MEIAADPAMPTYSGGLGILAGDILRSTADVSMPVVGVTLMYKGGYFTQTIDSTGMQQESETPWQPSKHAELLPQRVSIRLRNRTVTIAAWKRIVRPSHTGGREVPIYMLDTNLPENDPADRDITSRLYAGDLTFRLLQEGVLGIGGVYMLRALGHTDLETFHMNEGHAALLTIELLAEHSFTAKSNPADPAVIEAVRNRCVFTTHTPIGAGHDRFPLGMVFDILGDQSAIHESAPYVENGHLNMSLLALAYSRYANGVAQRHGEVSRHLLHDYRIDAITNGVHAPTWCSPAIAALLDQHCKNWRADCDSIRRAAFIPDEALAAARTQAKQALISHVNALTNANFSPDHFTLCFARRATAYKRADLLMSDPKRLEKIAERVGPIQIIYGGKAHPHDHTGKLIIQSVIQTLAALKGPIKGVYLPNYDFSLAKLLVSGVDLWVNTPIPPLEASGTSGMKAALNGVPSLSTPDGWWLEGAVEGVTGWTIGRDQYGRAVSEPDAAAIASALYSELEQEILPTFYRDRRMWTQISRQCIALNGPRFNTNRVVREYGVLAYGLK